MYKCVWLVEGGHGKNMSEENCQHINSRVGYIKHVVNHVLSAFCEHLHTGQIRQIMYVVQDTGRFFYLIILDICHRVFVRVLLRFAPTYFYHKIRALSGQLFQQTSGHYLYLWYLYLPVGDQEYFHNAYVIQNYCKPMSVLSVTPQGRDEGEVVVPVLAVHTAGPGQSEEITVVT